MSLLSIQMLLAGLDVLAQALAGDAIRSTPFGQLFAGGEWHGWVCAALMLIPAYVLSRQWWRESETSVTS